MLFRFIMVFALGLTCFSCSSKQKTEVKSHKQALESVVAEADRLTVISPFFGGKDLRGREGTKLAVIKGESNLKEFIALIDFKKESRVYNCNCQNTLMFKFSKQGRALANIGYEHYSMLSWEDGAWEGGRELTKKSIEDILKWFTKKGFKKFEVTYRKTLAENEAREKSFAFILKHFDSKRQAILKQANELEHPTEPQTMSIAEKGRQLYDSYENKAELLDVVFRIIGSEKSDRGYAYLEQVIISAVRLLNEEAFSSYLKNNQSMTDDMKRGLGSFLFFQHRLTKPLYQQHPAKINELVRFWLDYEYDYELAVIGMNTILDLDIPELNKMYEPYIQGEKEFKLKRRKHSVAPHVNIRYMILLKRAESGDQSVVGFCDELLGRKNTQIEQSILKISKALLDGDLSKINVKDYTHNISFLARSRVLLAEKYPSKKSYDILVAGTSHSFSSVRTKCVQAMEELTGKKWSQNDEDIEILEKSSRIQKWWLENRDTYEFSEVQN